MLVYVLFYLFQFNHILVYTEEVLGLGLVSSGLDYKSGIMLQFAY